MPTVDSHLVLIVEDNAGNASVLSQCVRSLRLRPHVVMTLDELDAALVDLRPCLVLLDKELPVSVGDIPLASTGDTAMKRLRALDARKTPSDHHIFPIIVVTTTSSAAPNVARHMRDGASEFIPKPIVPEVVTAAILAALERAERADHASCAACVAEAATSSSSASPAPASAEQIHLVLDGLAIGQRNGFLIAGKRRDMQDVPFSAFLRFAAERLRGSDGYIPKRELGMVHRPQIPNRIRDAVDDAVPPGFSIVQSGETGFFRFHPLVVVDSIHWVAYERHANPAIQNIATAERKRR